MASQKNFSIKNGLTVAGTERISASGDITGSHFGSFSGTSTTRSAGTNNTQLATTAYADTAVANLVASAPAALNTLDELAAALNDDASFSTTVTNSIATKLPLAGGTLTGDLTLQADGAEIFLKSADFDVARIIPRGSSGSNLDKGLLSLFDGGTEDIRIDTGGNSWIDTGNDLGIGTTTPGYKLEVNGTAHVVNTLTAGAIGIPSQGISLNQGFGTGVPTMTMLGTAANGRAGAILFQEQGAANTAAIYSTDGGTGNSSYGGLTIATYQSDLRFATNGLASTRMTIDASGNVGIGTTSPGTAKLNVTAGSSASTIVKFGSHYDTTLQMQATATASSSIQYLNAAGTGVVAMGYRDAGSGTDGAWRVRHAATLDTAGPYLNMATNGAVSISTDTSAAPVGNSHAQLELITTTNANPAHSVLAFASGVGRLGAIEAQQRAGGSAPYGHISTIVNNGQSSSGAMVRAITANYTGKVGVGKGHSTTPDMNLEVYAYNETSQWTSSGSYHGGTQAFAILSNSPPAPVAGDYGYYKEFWYYMNSNTSHTMIWDNADSYFNAEVQIVAACTNGGSNNNVYARGFWTNNHTAHNFAVIEGMTQTSASVGTVIINGASGGIGALANGNTFVFTASQGTNASNSGKLTLVHSYPGGSFYGAKIRLRVYFGQFNGHSSSS